MGSPLPLHIPVPALGVRLLLLAVGGVHSGFRLIQLHQVLPDGLVLGVVPLVLILAPLLSLAVEEEKTYKESLVCYTYTQIYYILQKVPLTNLVSEEVSGRLCSAAWLW